MDRLLEVIGISIVVLRKWLLLAALLAISGCQTQTRMLEQSGDIRVDPSNQPGSDYAVQLRNTLDFGFNPDDKANRHEWALNYLKSQCPFGRVVDEKMISTGTFGLGQPARTYFVYVACK